MDKYHLDGLRVDAVASMLYLDYSRKADEWIPNEFGGRENLQAISLLKEFNIQSHTQFPGVLTIAEESTAWPSVSRPTYLGGLGFSLKWNMGWMNDTLRYFPQESDPPHISSRRADLLADLRLPRKLCAPPFRTTKWWHGKGSLMDQMPGDLWQKFANMRLLLSYMWTHPGKKLLFMGGDFGQWNEWNYDESLQWHLLQYESPSGPQEDGGRRESPDAPRTVACTKSISITPASNGSIATTGKTACWCTCGKRKTRTILSSWPATSRRCRAKVICSACPNAAGTKKFTTATARSTAAATWANGPGIMAVDHMAHGRPHSVEITLPPPVGHCAETRAGKIFPRR